MTDRWTAETEDLVVRKLFGRVNVNGSDMDWDTAPLSAAARRDWRKRAADILTALADAGLLLAPGGETRPIWRVHNLTSSGSIVLWTLEAAQKAYADRAQPGAAWDPPPDPYALETANRTVWPDGSEYVGPWVPVNDGGGA